MEAYREASGPGEYRAPQEFIDYLRHAVVTGENLTCWWVPSVSRYDRLPDGSSSKAKGAWVIWDTVKEVVGLAMITKWVDVYRLDGEFGLPTYPGSWVADVLNHSNPCARGRQYRAKELNDYAEEDVLAKHRKTQRDAETIANDKFVRRIMAKGASGSTPSKEDVKKQIAELQEDVDDLNKVAEMEAKDMRVYPEHA